MRASFVIITVIAVGSIVIAIVLRQLTDLVIWDAQPEVFRSVLSRAQSQRIIDLVKSIGTFYIGLLVGTNVLWMSLSGFCLWNQGVRRLPQRRNTTAFDHRSGDGVASETDNPYEPPLC